MKLGEQWTNVHIANDESTKRQHKLHKGIHFLLYSSFRSASRMYNSTNRTEGIQ